MIALPRPGIWTPADGPPRKPWWMEWFAGGMQRNPATGGGKRNATHGSARRNVNSPDPCCCTPTTGVTCPECTGTTPATRTIQFVGITLCTNPNPTLCECSVTGGADATYTLQQGLPSSVFKVPDPTNLPCQWGYQAGPPCPLPHNNTNNCTHTTGPGTDDQSSLQVSLVYTSPTAGSIFYGALVGQVSYNLFTANFTRSSTAGNATFTVSNAYTIDDCAGGADFAGANYHGSCGQGGYGGTAIIT